MNKKVLIKAADGVEISFSIEACQNIMNRWQNDFEYLPSDEAIMLHMESEIDKLFKKHKIGSAIKKAISQELSPIFNEMILKEIRHIKMVLKERSQ